MFVIAEGSSIPAICNSGVCGGLREQVQSGAQQRYEYHHLASLYVSLTKYFFLPCRLESSEKQEIHRLHLRAEHSDQEQACDPRATASVRDSFDLTVSNSVHLVVS